MSTPATTPATRFRLTSPDLDGAIAHMQASYTRFDATATTTSDFEFAIEGAVAGPVELSTLRYSLPGRAATEPSGRLIAVAALPDTRMRLISGHEDLRGSVGLIAPSSPCTTEWYDVRATIVALDPTEVARVGGELTGLDAGAVAFHAMTPRTPALGRYWTDLVTHVRRSVLAHDALLDEPLLRAQTVRQLATGLLAAFPNTSHTLEPSRGPDTAAPACLRRAVEFIEVHAPEPITLTEIADAAGTSPRALQRAFARHRDTNPLAYLRRVRLHRAHADLVASDPGRGDTVAAVAARWGFPHAARFATHYREEFGQLPSRVLHR